MSTDHVMSQIKYEEFGRDLDRLKKEKPQAAREVARLVELGDFSENVEYQLAKRRLRGINNTILRLEYRINNAEVIKKGTNDSVQIGSRVTIKTPKGERIYTILGAAEADPSNGVISHQSPLGSALLGHRAGDVIKVDKVGECAILIIG